MSRGKVTLYLDSDRLKKMAAERGMNASALIELALDMLDHDTRDVVGTVAVPATKSGSLLTNPTKRVKMCIRPRRAHPEKDLASGRNQTGSRGHLI